jgi:L-fuconolactonase
VDTHIHLWALPRDAPPMEDGGTFPSHSSPAWLAKNALMADYDATAGGALVGRVVVIEAVGGVPNDKVVKSNLWMLSQLEEEPKLLSVVGGLDVRQESSAFLAQLAELATHRGFVGLRIHGSVLRSGGEGLHHQALSNIKELERRNMVLDVIDAEEGSVLELARMLPKLNIVIDHLWQKSFDFEVPPWWRARLEAAKASPNVHLKISDTGRLNQGSRADGWSTPYPSSDDPTLYAGVFEAVFEAFGEDRLVFGSNWPVSNVAGDFVAQVRVLEAFLERKGQVARNKVFHDNAMRLYAPRR